MWSVLELISLQIISLLIQSVLVSTHALIGNYSELNTKECGINRMTNSLIELCFEWHKSPVSTLIGGRNATEGEVPWIVDIRRTQNTSLAFDNLLFMNKCDDYLFFSLCTGSTIGKEWVLTAGHCLVSNNSDDYEIYLGYLSWQSLDNVYKVKAVQFHRHPDYYLNSSSILNDLALFKLEKPINSIQAIVGQRVSTHLKSICLPKRDITNTKNEYALTAGWGYVNRTELPLQMGYKLVRVNKSNQTDKNILLAKVVNNQTFNCRGDSGSPLWQFSNGRAVIIGVLSIAAIGQINGVLCEYDPHSPSQFIRVSNYIDWIINVTQNN